MKRTVPTERLAKVLAEADLAIKSHQNMKVVLAQVLRDWGIMPQEAIMAELREALDQANAIPMPSAIPEALAYLKVNIKTLERQRNLVRKGRGQGPVAYEVDLPTTPTEIPRVEAGEFTLDDITEKLKKLA